MKKLLAVVMAVGLLGMVVGSAMGASTDTGYIELVITPITVVDIVVSPTYYNFGSVDVQISTCSTVAMVLTNNGTIGFTVQKAVWDAGADWDITLASSVTDGYDLWAFTSASQPGQGDFDNIGNYRFSKTGTGHASYTDLFVSAGAQVDMSPEASSNMWFRLDMPKYVTNENQQTIQVRLKALKN